MMKQLWLALCALSLAGVAVAQNAFVYTNDNNSPNTVSAFKVATNGSLTLLAGSPFSTGGNGGGSNTDPEEITVTARPRGSFIYAANDADGNISAFKVNTTSGALAQVAGSPFHADGPPGGNYSLTTSPSGQFLFATSDSTTVIHVYTIATNGSLAEVAGSPFSTGANSQGSRSAQMASSSLWVKLRSAPWEFSPLAQPVYSVRWRVLLLPLEVMPWT
jgi:6-phosphogluconolactonase (cycloisomerase 2 family)